jgi:outer membrane protein insertion porin family
MQECRQLRRIGILGLGLLMAQVLCADGFAQMPPPVTVDDGAQAMPATPNSEMPTPDAPTSDANVPTIASIEVEGTRRVDPGTIRTYLGVEAGDVADSVKLNESLKKLYATDLFSDVRLRLEGQTLIVKVQENPLINRIAFEGNKKHDDDDLIKEIYLRPRSVYSRPKVQQDVERIIDIYQRTGRFQVEVSPKIIPRSQNRVDLVFEVEEGPTTKVAQVYFVGNRQYDAGTLKSIIRTEPESWFKFFSADDTYDPDRLAYDKELLRRHYVKNGYADFQVKSVVAELAPEGDGFYITYTVDEGEQYQFGNITVQNMLPDVEQEALDVKVLTQGGETYNAIQVEDSVDALVDELGNQGYAFIDIDPDLKRDEAAKTIDVTYVVAEGPRVYVDRINIDGNVRTLDKVIRREFRLAEGDPFSASKLKRSEQRIQNLGYFARADVKTERGSAPDRADINVQVEEQSTGELSLGAGFSTVDGLLTDISVAENNLLGAGKQLRARLMLATQRQDVDIGYTEPYFLGREIATGFDIFRVQQDLIQESSFDREAVGGAVRASYALSEHLMHTFSYTLREDAVSNVAENASLFIRAQQGEYVTSALGHVLMYDRRDNVFQPTEGHFVRLRQDFAGLGGDVEYLRTDLRTGFFYSIQPQWILNLIGYGGYMWGWGDESIRINDRFFMGARDIRGFRNAGVGPRDSITRDALGGNAYYALTTELTFPLGLPSELDFRGAAFVDVGSLWNAEETGGNVLDDNSPRVVAGIGLLWNSPFGPIRLDLATPLVKEEYDQPQMFRFSFGQRF